MKVTHSPPMKASLSYIPFNITFTDLKYSIVAPLTQKKSTADKIILKNVSGICKSGEVTAILGSSGAGKTTLLNALCKRIKNNLSTGACLTGRVEANLNSYSNDNFHDFAAYVMQDDILPETITVRECIQFAAEFKVRGTKQERLMKVDEVISRLKLEKCQNTLIGGHFLKGISGGERKRTSIAFELVSDPAVIFLDEPTSGLDSFTAYILVNELRQFAQERNRTVVFTIHQPSTDIWNMFDRIMLMINGEMIYQGPGKQTILDYFTYHGFACPYTSNPADYLLSIMHSQSESNRNNFPVYTENYQAHLKPLVEEELKLVVVSNIPKRPFLLAIINEIPLVLKRTFKVNFRNPILMRSRLIQSIIMALFIGAVWWQITDGVNDPTNLRDAMNRSGLLYFFCVQVFMGSVNPCVLTFPADKLIFLREENAKLYRSASYFIAKIVIDIFTCIPLPFFSTVIAYFMTGLRLDTGAFFYFMATMIILSFTGISVGYLVGTACTSARTAMNIMPAFVFPAMLFSGFYKNRGDYADWIGWLEYASPLKYGFQALSLNEYQVTPFIPNPIVKYNFEFSMGGVIGILIGYFVIITTVAFFLLILKKQRLQ